MPRTPRQLRGDSAESAVAEYLEALDFEILGRNVRVGAFELDLVARKDELVVVVEVRSRGKTAWTTGFGSLDAGKRARIRRAAERLWRTRLRKDQSLKRLRFDAASVSYDERGARIEYAKAAF